MAGGQPIYHGGVAIASALDFAGLIEHLRNGHRQPPPAVERVLMRQKLSPQSENACLIWPAWQHDRALGIKITSIFPNNTDRPAVQALYVLLDGGNGAPKALLDGTELTYWKTAADSALGADYLARGDADTFLMVGAGALAPFLIRAYRAIRPGLTRVLIWNRTRAKAERLARAIPRPTRAKAVADLENAVAEADIVCCATASHEPLIRGEWLRPGTHLDLIGGFTPRMREADDEAVRRARLFVDSRWFTVEHVGDLTQPIANGVITSEEVDADLFDLCAGRHPGRRDAREITLFKSGGGAHLDLMTAQHIAAHLDSPSVEQSGCSATGIKLKDSKKSGNSQEE
jgi:ornithine cyclodeaminase